MRHRAIIGPRWWAACARPRRRRCCAAFSAIGVERSDEPAAPRAGWLNALRWSALRGAAVGVCGGGGLARQAARRIPAGLLAAGSYPHRVEDLDLAELVLGRV